MANRTGTLVSAVFSPTPVFVAELSGTVNSIAGGTQHSLCALTPTKVFMTTPPVKAVSTRRHTSLALTNACICP